MEDISLITVIVTGFTKSLRSDIQVSGRSWISNGAGTAYLDLDGCVNIA